MFYCSKVEAQIATSSFFGQIQSINPGVLNKRRAGFMSLGGAKDQYTKEQKFNADEVQGSSGGSAESLANINNINFFRGGKGGVATSEFNFISTKGNLKETVTLENNSITSTESDAKVTYASFQTALSAIGIGGSFFQYDYSNSYNIVLDGDNYEGDFTAKINSLFLSAGWAGSIGQLRIGLMSRLVRSSLQSTGTSELENVSNSSFGVLVGAGLGIETNNFHFEIGLETPLADAKPPENAIDVNRATPMRVSGVVEFKWGSMVLGYIGTLYSGAFNDASTTVENQLIYTSPENRLVNKFNIAFGVSKGFSVSGSFASSTVTTQEKVPFYGTTNLATQVKSKSVSVELSYVY